MNRSRQDYVVDPARTTLEWTVKHAFGLGWVRGAFTDVEGTVEMVDGAPVAAHAMIRVEPFDTGNPRRDTHLRSPDFFWVERHPTIAFTTTRIEPVDSDAYRVMGTLTVRGISAPVALDARVEERSRDTDGGQLMVRLTGTLDRRDVGMVWRRGLGPIQLAYDEVRLTAMVSLTSRIAGASVGTGRATSRTNTSPPHS